MADGSLAWAKKGPQALERSKVARVVVDGQAVPIGADLDSASASEIKRLQSTIENISVLRKGGGRPRQNPVRIIADKGCDSDPLGQKRLKGGIELICPYCKNKQTKKDEDGGKFRPDRRRWKVEQTLAWRPNWRRRVVDWEREIQIDQAFFHLACILITLRPF
ncbi:MAG: hypothetical protein QF595_07050 [Dehalococcoidia bacterium]|nr:hypothetical protein [Dehalococcoidia bacterium]